METLKTINFIIAVIFFVCYTYQFLYIPVPWLRKEKPHGPAKANRYAVLICARNEQRVIGDLIASLRGRHMTRACCPFSCWRTTAPTTRPWWPG